MEPTFDEIKALSDARINAHYAWLRDYERRRAEATADAWENLFRECEKEAST